MRAWKNFAILFAIFALLNHMNPNTAEAAGRNGSGIVYNKSDCGGGRHLLECEVLRIWWRWAWLRVRFVGAQFTTETEGLEQRGS